MRKNNAFVAKIANMRLTKTFVAIFALAERLPTSATLDHCHLYHLHHHNLHDHDRGWSGIHIFCGRFFITENIFHGQSFVFVLFFSHGQSFVFVFYFTEAKFCICFVFTTSKDWAVKLFCPSQLGGKSHLQRKESKSHSLVIFTTCSTGRMMMMMMVMMMVMMVMLMMVMMMTVIMMIEVDRPSHTLIWHSTTKLHANNNKIKGIH